jgi:hypothetical protein
MNEAQFIVAIQLLILLGLTVLLFLVGPASYLR